MTVVLLNAFLAGFFANQAKDEPDALSRKALTIAACASGAVASIGLIIQAAVFFS